MKKKSIAVAYPTIPIIFLGGIRENRRPIYNTIGLAVTDLNEEVRAETSVEIMPLDYGITFTFAGKPLSGDKGKDTFNAIHEFLHIAGMDVGLKIESNNYKTFSGSSDAGLAALFAALNDVLEASVPQREIAKLAMKGSESAIRSVFGGMSEIVVDPYPELYGVGLATAEDLKEVRIFAIPFEYPARITADEIHAGIVTHPWYKYRVERIPEWVAKIKFAISNKDIIGALKLAEENVRNAHYLLEEVGLRVRKKEMMNVCLDIEDIRAKGCPAYYLIGGGNLISVATTTQYADNVEKELTARGLKFVKYKVAGGPKVVKSE